MRVMNTPRLHLFSVTIDGDESLEGDFVDSPRGRQAAEKAYHRIEDCAYVLVVRVLAGGRREELKIGVSPIRSRVLDDQLMSILCDGYSPAIRIPALLRAGASPNAEADFGQGKVLTALGVASMRSALCVDALLKAGADVRRNAASNLALARDPAVRSLLINAGADVNEADHRGLTALMIAAIQNPSAVPNLLDYGADGCRQTHDGRTAADLCVDERAKGLLEAHAAAQQLAHSLEDNSLGPQRPSTSSRPRL